MLFVDGYPQKIHIVGEYYRLFFGGDFDLLLVG
jgi:hypothetical protein